MSLRDLESVIYGSCFILTGEDRTGGTRTYTDKEAAAWKEEHPDTDQIFQTETEAVATLLAERGLDVYKRQHHTRKPLHVFFNAVHVSPVPLKRSFIALSFFLLCVIQSNQFRIVIKIFNQLFKHRFHRYIHNHLSLIHI